MLLILKKGSGSPVSVVTR